MYNMWTTNLVAAAAINNGTTALESNAGSPANQTSVEDEMAAQKARLVINELGFGLLVVPSSLEVTKTSGSAEISGNKTVVAATSTLSEVPVWGPIMWRPQTPVPVDDISVKTKAAAAVVIIDKGTGLGEMLLLFHEKFHPVSKQNR
jgi:hypothetical protein